MDEVFITKRTRGSFNVRTLVGLGTRRAKRVIADHGCTFHVGGYSVLTNLESNRVDVKVRNRRVIWARVG